MTNGQQTPPPRRGGMGWLWIVLIVVIVVLLIWWWWPRGEAGLEEGEIEMDEEIGLLETQPLPATAPPIVLAEPV